ncbi:hypothetical protein Dimus_026113 [Dionaea muscipula]
MENGGSSPPHWQLPVTVTRHGRASSSSAFLNSSLAIILIPSLAMLLIFIAIPSFTTTIFTFHSTNPQSAISKSVPMKSSGGSWGTINVVLVVFAILCGIFSRRNQDQSISSSREWNQNQEILRNNNSTVQLHQLFDGPVEEKTHTQPVATGVFWLGRRGDMGSYADSRQHDRWKTAATNERLRLFDGFDLNRLYPLPSSDYVHRRKLGAETDGGEGCAVKDIPVETLLIRSEQHLPPPPPPPPHEIRIERKRAYEDRYSWEERVAETAAPNPPAAPSPEAAAQEMDMASGQEEKSRRKERKKSNATKEIASALASLYSKRNKKRNQKIKHEAASVEPFPPHLVTPPTPPPPPSPPSVFHRLLKTESKSKKIHSLSPPPSPPRPQPLQRPPESLTPSSKQRNQINCKRSSQSPPPSSPISGKASRLRAPIEAGNSPSTTTSTASDLYERDEDVLSGCQPPLFPVVPAPPPSAFRQPETKDFSRCGFVSVREAHSSPELEDVDVDASDEINGGDGNGPWSGCCPSPDVNVKADTFIARHHDGWRLEKLNSWREPTWAHEDAD